MVVNELDDRKFDAYRHMQLFEQIELKLDGQLYSQLWRGFGRELYGQLYNQLNMNLKTQLECSTN